MSSHAAVTSQGATKDTTILTALWSLQSPSFPRLPSDAPVELIKDTVTVEDPERVYSIYRASRRHHFQLLVERFILQVRYGCRVAHCSTPTCFSCRKRIAGSRPVRRYNVTSARVLACHLASQDDPEAALCPHLNSRSSVNLDKNQAKVDETVSPLKKYEPSVAEPVAAREPRTQRSLEHERHSADVEKEAVQSPSSKNQSTTLEPQHLRDIIDQGSERVKIDPRSFTQNVFSTEAMKMLEWLTPSSVDNLAGKLKRVLKGADKSHSTERKEAATGDGDIITKTTAKATTKTARKPGDHFSDAMSEMISTRTSTEGSGMNLSSEGGLDTEDVKHALNSRPMWPATPGPRHHRRRVENPRSPPPQRISRGSHMLPELKRRESSDLEIASKLQRVNSFSDETSLARRLSNDKRNRINRSSSIKSISSYSSHDMVLPPVGELPLTPKKVALIAGNVSAEDGNESRMALARQVPLPVRVKQPELAPADHAKLMEGAAAQSLGFLTVQSIDLMCNILLADGPPQLREKVGQKFKITKPTDASGDRLRIKRQSNTAKDWKKFIEQSFFYVLSDSQSLLRSFRAKNNQLLDSRTLQYCLMLLYQAMPDLYLDALWVAAADLYRLPSELTGMQIASKQQTHGKSAIKQRLDKRGEDASDLLTILCHALIAIAPCSFNPAITLTTSLERGKGRAYIDRDDGGYSLALDDALSDELALRLAYRVFAAIPVQKTMYELNVDGKFEEAEEAVLGSLMKSLKGFNKDKRSPTTVFHVDYREPPETRSATILLDFARAVMLNKWNHSPIVTTDGSFGGAVNLLMVLYSERSILGLGDNLFSTQYLQDQLDASSTPLEWLSMRRSRKLMHILDVPFLFTEERLATYFRAINYSRMNAAYDAAATMSIRVNAITSPSNLTMNSDQLRFVNQRLKVAVSRFFVISVSRGNILGDAFDQLWRREPRELVRPLKVRLGEESGEMGSDSGGVQSEFFRLAIAEATNPDYGAFSVDDRTKMIWFQPSSPVPLWKFELIGLIFALAAYNAITLPVTFPKAFYRKLLDLPVIRLKDIEDGWPDLASGLTTLADWDEKNGAVDDVFCRTFEFSLDVFGRTISRNMCDKEAVEQTWPQFETLGDPAKHPPTTADAEASEVPMVTADNRREYIGAYIHHLADLSIQPQFEAFQRGFSKLILPQSLKLFTPELLQEVLEGVQKIDVDELEKVVRYEGFDAGSPTIKFFWSVVREFSQDQLKKLLEFVTASERVPVGGVGGVTFVIQRNGEDYSRVEDIEYEGQPGEQGWRQKGGKGRLPTAYTCYGTMLLPEYKERETLKRKLLMAMENAKGFGFA